MLVHGAWHGPWCWERVLPGLEARGHTVAATELHRQRATETLRWSTSHSLFMSRPELVVDLLDRLA